MTRRRSSIARRRSVAMVAAALVATATGIACDSGRADAVMLSHSSTDPVLRLTILGDSNDSRIPPVREAIGFWNGELARLGLRLRMDSGVIAGAPVPEDMLRSASAANGKPWRVIVDARLRAGVSDVPGDVVIALSHGDLISFGVPWSGGRKGVVAVRRADVLPLSRPNTVRNVVAHELGHVLGLSHNPTPPRSCAVDPQPAGRQHSRRTVRISTRSRRAMQRLCGDGGLEPFGSSIAKPSRRVRHPRNGPSDPDPLW
jgi:hypothetical protein